MRMAAPPAGATLRLWRHALANLTTRQGEGECVPVTRVPTGSTVIAPWLRFGRSSRAIQTWWSS